MTFLKEEEWRLYRAQGWLRLDEHYLFAMGFRCPICRFTTFSKYRVGRHGCADDRDYPQSDLVYAHGYRR